MHVVLISGSHRQSSQSSKVAHYLAARLPVLRADCTADIIDLAGNPLPLWDEGAWQADSETSKRWMPYAGRLNAAEALVVVSPEWAGMVAPGLKNFFLFPNIKNVGHKPALIVTVSSSRGGSYPVNELRTSSYKNNRLLYIPEHLIVRDAESMLNGSEAANKDDAYLRARADFALNVLLAYGAALNPARAEIIAATGKAYANGM